MQAQTPAAAQRAVIELRYYRVRSGPQVQRTTDYLQHGLLPACERAGIRPVGCFNALIAPDSPFFLALVSYPSTGRDRNRSREIGRRQGIPGRVRGLQFHARAVVHAHG